MTVPILMLGAGRMGGAMVDGWRRGSAFAPADLILCDPMPGAAALKAAQAGATLNPPLATLMRAKTVVLAVKPQMWREAAAAYADKLAIDVVVVSIAAGVKAGDIEAAFSRPVARVMPTTGAAIGKGVASIYSASPEARARAHALFDPGGVSVDLADEDLMDAATAVSGSSPAYLYAFVEALEAAGVTAGLAPDAARTLARATIASAAALMEASGEEPSELRRQVTSPGGTTEAALKVLLSDRGLPTLMRDAVDAAAARAKELGG